jgi:hypothetical protein
MRLSWVTSLLKYGRLKELHQILSRGGEKGLSGFILFFTEKIQGKNPRHGQVNPTIVPDGQPSVESFNSTYFTCCTV